MDSKRQPPSSLNATSTVGTGLLMLFIGLQSLPGASPGESYRLLSYFLAYGSIAGGLIVLYWSTRYWLKYIHEYVDYRLAERASQLPPNS